MVAVKRVLPPVLFLFAILAMTALWKLLPVTEVVSFPFSLTGLPLVLLGIAMTVAGSNQFDRAGTNIKTFDDPEVLVTEGLFRYTRNPMYLGFSIALLGIALSLGNLSAFAVVAAFVVVVDRWYIRYEENRMEHVFGDEYEAYKNRTRRWL